MTTDPLLRVENLTMTLPSSQGAIAVLNNVSFSIQRGEIFGIVGESGSGKTMTSLALMRLLPSQASVTATQMKLGEVDLMTAPPVQFRGCAIAMIFQDPAAALNPVFTVGQQMDLLLHRHHPDFSREERKERVLGLLSDVGLPSPETVLKRYPHQLSGGMQQRVLIAMALSAEPDLLIADEPTTALDVTVQKQILDLLKDISQRRALSVLFISHDLGVVASLCNRIAVMRKGEIVEMGSVTSVLLSPQAPYTRALLAAMPRRNTRGQRLLTVTEEAALS